VYSIAPTKNRSADIPGGWLSFWLFRIMSVVDDETPEEDFNNKTCTRIFRPPISTTRVWHVVPTSKTGVDGPDAEDETPQPQHIEISHSNAPLPIRDIACIRDILSREEVELLNREIDNGGSQQQLPQEEDTLSDSDDVSCANVGSWVWEGYDGPRRRVKSFDMISNTNNMIQTIRQRLSRYGWNADRVEIEEYEPTKRLAKYNNTHDPTIFSTFAINPQLQYSTPLQEGEETSSWFVAEILLGNVVDEESTLSSTDGCDDGDLLLSWNQPENQMHPMCWNLKSPEAWTDVKLNQRTALIRSGKMLTEWRSSRVLLLPNTNHANSTKIRVLRLSKLPKEKYNTTILDNASIVTTTTNSITNTAELEETDTFGYVPSLRNERIRQERRQNPTPPMIDLLTIVITTSPIKSNPSTEVLEKSMATFVMGGNEFAYQCRKVIICDGYREQQEHSEIIDEPKATNVTTNYNNNNIEQGGKKKKPHNPHYKVSRKHNNVKQALRNGIVTSEQAENYRQFKCHLRKLCNNKDCGTKHDRSVFINTEMVELEERHGYGFALRHALRHYVQTPFVCVIQHDRTFMRPTPISETLNAMWRNPQVKYVGFSMRSNLLYRDIFLGRYGGGNNQQRQQEWNDMVLHLPEMRVLASEYGPDSSSARTMTYNSEKLRHNMEAFVEAYKGSAQAATSNQNFEGNGDDISKRLHQMTLVPTLFFYDNIHICETEHYRDFIFHPSYKMVAKGGFVEDKLSPVIKRTVERLGLKDGHSRFGCYLLDDHSGLFFTGHLDGGSYMLAEERKELIAMQRSSSKIGS
jgi:hypothetical protein